MATSLTAFATSYPFPLDPFQREACEALERGRGVLVAAPTGAGKTVVGEFAVHLALTQGRKAFYTTPIKALSNQKYHDLVARHGPDAVGLLTGDTTVNGEAPVVVMTTEVLRNMLYADSPTLAGLGYVVMDEVHYLADRFRGPVWEEVILHLEPAVQIASLSATVSNAEEFGDWLTAVRGDTAVVVSETRPVPLWQHVMTSGGILDLYAVEVDPTDPGVDPPINPELTALRVPGRSRGDRGYRGRGGRRPGDPGPGVVRRTPPRFAVVDVLDREALLPAIFFVFSRAGCDAAVQQCLRAGLRLTTPEQAAEIRRTVEERCQGLPPADLAVLGYGEWALALERGLAAHHAGLLPLFKETVEDLFSRGLVKVVFATETLALGINMPARSVVLDRLDKWDGSAHAPITPGEYTQLTGRAGRRGIDVEGHAVVVDHPGLDPVALAGLASRRTYPLSSSFRPTYNMSVNLVARVGRRRAREILEMSFAQFQADRGVVGLARQAQAHAEALDGYAAAMACHLGDFAAYARLRRELRDRERGASKDAGRRRRAENADALARAAVGDVLEIRGGRRSGHAVVVAVRSGLEGPRVTVVATDGRLRTVTPVDVPAGLRTVARVTVRPGFAFRSPKARNDLAAAARAALADPAKRVDPAPRPPARAEAEDETVAELRRRLRAHPCHACPDREEHARWAERHHRLEREHAGLVRRIEGRTGSIARTFDKVCDVLADLGYLAGSGDGVDVTAAGESLRRIYAEDDLLVAQCLREGVWDRLDAPALAAVVAAVVFQARREDGGEEVPAPLRAAVDATVRVWSRLEDAERAHGVEPTPPPDLGLVGPVHAWARGRPLAAVLGETLTAGDFVRWCKQVIDLLDQLTDAGSPALRATARAAVPLVRRGVVAYSSL